jgi:hypothetical protein
MSFSSAAADDPVHTMKKIVSTLVLLLGIPLSAAQRPHIVSQLRDGAIVADGRFDDWYGSLQPLADHPLSVQILNDSDFLYLRLTASDAATRMQIVRLGFTVWFDPAGGTKKVFGIRYPAVERGEAEGPGGFGGFGRGRGREPAAGEREAEAPGDRVDILGPGKDDARSLTRDHLSGVEVGIHAEQGLLQYELKVPLLRTGEHPYAIGTQPGRTIGLGLETGKMQQRRFGEERGGGYGGTGGRGGGIGRHGGGEGRRGEEGRGFQPPKPVKVWATVAIAPAR